MIELETLNFDYLTYNRSQLRECLLEIFNRLGLVERFNLDRSLLKNFIYEVSHNYRRVPYHNFTHVFNIVHVSYYILKVATELRSHLEDIDVLAIIIGALGHDLDH